MNLFALSGLLIAVTSGGMAILMFLLGRKKLHYLWGIFCISAFFWGIGAYMIAATTDINKADFWWRITHIGVIFIPILFTHFVYEFLNIKKKLFVIIIYVLGAIFLITNFINGLFIANMRWVFNQFYYDSPPGPFYIPFTTLFFGLVIYSLIKLWKAFKIAKGITRVQIKYFFAGMAISFAGGGLSFLPVYKIDLYPIFNLTAFLFTIIIGYTILKYRLMDIRIVARKIFIYIGLAGFAYGIFYLIAWIYTKSFGGVFTTTGYLAGVFIAPAFVIAFYWLNKCLQFIANKYFFYSLFNYEETINKLSRELNYYNDLDKIINLIVETIKKTMQLDRAGVLLINKDKKPTYYQIAKVIGFNEQNGIALVKQTILTKYLQKTQEPLVRDELAIIANEVKTRQEKDDYKKLVDNMKRIEASLCLPLMSSEQLIGIIVLGSKISGDAYTREDLELLTTLSYQAGIAIDNARLYKEVQEFTKTLQQKVNEQTKEIVDKNINLEKLLKMRSEFLDIASHQLRTPVSVIKGVTSMMMEGDIEKLPKQDQRQYIEGLFQKAKKLEQIINDILSASEFDTHKFSINPDSPLIQVEEVVDDAVKSLKIEAQRREIDLIWQKPVKPLAKVKGEARYLEQALANIIDNALKYTPSIKKVSEARDTRPYKGRVEITAYQEGDNVIVKISDNGIGIPPAEFNKLFQKFARATNAVNMYTDGSGLGLFIVKEIIDGHQGKIWFESKVNKGTRFYIGLPVADIK